METENIRV